MMAVVRSPAEKMQRSLKRPASLAQSDQAAQRMHHIELDDAAIMASHSVGGAGGASPETRRGAA